MVLQFEILEENRNTVCESSMSQAVFYIMRGRVSFAETSKDILQIMVYSLTYIAEKDIIM